MPRSRTSRCALLLQVRATYITGTTQSNGTNLALVVAKNWADSESCYVDLLVIGGSGFIGGKIVAAASRASLNVCYTYRTHKLNLPVPSIQLDVRDEEKTHRTVRELRPKVVLYCAKPALDGAETEHIQVSVDGAKAALLGLCGHSARFIYVSTNAVFSGARGKYKEGDVPDLPLRYGYAHGYRMARAKGEILISSLGMHTVVARLADVNGRDVSGKLNSRLQSMVDVLYAGTPIKRFSRCFISPTLVDDVADSFLLLLTRKLCRMNETLHLCSNARVSYYQFGVSLAKHLGVRASLVVPDPGPLQDLSMCSAYTRRILTARFSSIPEQLTKILGPKPFS